MRGGGVQHAARGSDGERVSVEPDERARPPPAPCVAGCGRDPSGVKDACAASRIHDDDLASWALPQNRAPGALGDERGDLSRCVHDPVRALALRIRGTKRRIAPASGALCRVFGVCVGHAATQHRRIATPTIALARARLGTKCDRGPHSALARRVAVHSFAL